MRSHKHLFVINYTKLFMRKKKSDSEIEPKEKKSRAKFDCLPELKEVLYTVNSVPPGIIMPTATEVVDKFEKEYFLKYNVSRKSDLDDSTVVAMWFDILDECFKDFLDENQKKRIFESWFERTQASLSELKKSEVALFWSVFKTYEFIRKTRDDVKAVINYVRMLNEKSPVLYLYKSDLHTPLSFTQKNGETRANLPAFSKIIERIDLERLRFCEICSRVFWANYKNSFTCSPTCLNTLRQRRHRKKNADEINKTRRENYARNKKLKELKESK